MRVLVGTLYSGENELPQCLDALRAQRYGRWEHVLIEHLPEKAAHSRLYQRFMQAAGEFDLLLKLDADMVLVDEARLGAAVRLFEDEPRLDHAIFSVHDWMTDRPIIGIHMYRSRVRWPVPDDLFTDLPPEVTGRRRYVLRRPPSPLALHSPDPSPAQALHYGLHRGLKACQFGLPLHAVSHWRRLRLLWRRFDRCRDSRVGLALLGADLALAGEVTPGVCDYTDPRFVELLARYRDLTADELIERLRPAWGSAPRRDVRWLGALGRRVTGRGAA